MSDYWEEQRVKKDFNEFVESFNGCLHCGCDHGCNGWIEDQRSKTGLILLIIQHKGITKLDKVAQLHPDKANKIWYRIRMWQAEKFNRDLRAGKYD